VYLFDPAKGEQLLAFKGHPSVVFSVAFSPDGARLLTGSCDHTARIWDVRTGREILTLRRHMDAVQAVAFSRDGRHVATAGRDKAVFLYSASDWTKTAEQLEEERLARYRERWQRENGKTNQ
jgi:WD40 repeat protein